MKSRAGLGPKIFKYLDFRVFMRDFYEDRKARDPNFSFAVWNSRADFKSRSYLRLVMVGKRDLSPDSMLKVAQALELNKKESEFFDLLVRFNQAKNLETREYYLKQVLKISHRGATENIRDNYLFLSSYKAPRILSYLVMEDVNRSPEKMCQVFSLASEDLNEILESLKNLGLISWVPESSEWRANVRQVEAPSQLGNLAIQSFHKKMLKESESAIQLDPTLRQLLSITLTLSEDQYADCIQEIHSFADFLLQRFQTQTGNNKKIHHLNLQLIPVSEVLIRRDTPLRVQEHESADQKHEVPL